MNGQALSGSRKLNKHWQSGGGGNFAPLNVWYIVGGINAGIGYSVVRSSWLLPELEFPVVYHMPAPYVPSDVNPIIGITSWKEGDIEDANPALYYKPRLGFRHVLKPFSKVTVTIKERRNKTGIDWYISPVFEIMHQKGITKTSEDNFTAEAQGTKGTWYKDTYTAVMGQLSGIPGLNKQDVYRLKDGVIFTFSADSGTTWDTFTLINFNCYYIWDPVITADKKQYNSPEAEEFIKTYNAAMAGGAFNAKILRNLWQWDIKIKAE